MAGLRTLLEYGGAIAPTVNFDTLYVYNVNKTTAENGGSCCLWTVPAGVTWFAVELWGGGGGGAGACCCFQGWGGGSGSYARKFITGLSGDGGEQYTICAAGTTACSQNFCNGCDGFPSYVSVNGGAVQICAQGGRRGFTRCYFGSNCNRQGCRHCQEETTAFCGTMGIPGIYGGAKGSPMCFSNTWQTMNQAPFTMTSHGFTRNACSGFCGGCCSGGYARWPGGGGASAAMHDNTCFAGAAGAGGLVNIYYPIITS